MRLGDHAIALPASSPPDALHKVALFLLLVGGGSGSNPTPSGGENIGGGGGIRTHVAARTAKSISSRPRYGHFGTPPRAGKVL